MLCRDLQSLPHNVFSVMPGKRVHIQNAKANNNCIKEDLLDDLTLRNPKMSINTALPSLHLSSKKSNDDRKEMKYLLILLVGFVFCNSDFSGFVVVVVLVMFEVMCKTF